MKPVDQTILAKGPDDKGGDPLVGDCWRCCIASVLEVGAEDVPHFAVLPVAEWWEATQSWLEGRALQLFEYDYSPYVWVPPGFTLLSGRSPRGEYDHTVVGWGVSIAHDPHPSRAGLRGGPKRIAVFVALDPGRMS